MKKEYVEWIIRHPNEYGKITDILIQKEENGVFWKCGIIREGGWIKARDPDIYSGVLEANRLMTGKEIKHIELIDSKIYLDSGIFIRFSFFSIEKLSNSLSYYLKLFIQVYERKNIEILRKEPVDISKLTDLVQDFLDFFEIYLPIMYS